MTTQEPYNQRTLNIQAAEFYKSIRKEKSKWKSIIDLSPMLAEFRHYIAAGDYEKAFYVYDSIHGYIANWCEYTRVIAMGETLLSEKDPFLKLSDVIVMKIKTYMSWSYINVAQFDIGERLSLEAKIIGHKLLANEPPDDDNYKSACEFMTMIFNNLIHAYTYTGRKEQALEVIEESGKILNSIDNLLYKASKLVSHGWALQEFGEAGPLTKQLESEKLYQQVDEIEMDPFWLNAKGLLFLNISGEYSKFGHCDRCMEYYLKAQKIHTKTNAMFLRLAPPSYSGPGYRYSYSYDKAREIVDIGIDTADKFEHIFGLEKSISVLGDLIRDEGIWHIFINKSEPEKGEEKPYEYQKKAFTFFQAAIDNYQKAVKMADTLGLTANMAKLHGKIGNIYCRLGDGDPGLFVLAEENLKKALDLAQSDTTKYGTCLNLGRLYVYEAGKIYKDSRGRRKEEAVNKVNQANECFTRVYEDAGKKDDNGNAVKDANGNVVWDEPVYGAKAAYRLGVAALETALVNESDGDDKKKKFDEASEKFHEAADLFKNCAAEVKKNKFLSGQEAEDFREKYGEEPIDLRSLAEMKYGRAVALLGALVFADEYVSEKDVKEHRKREVRQAYEDAFSQVPDSIDFLREAFRELNMLRVSLGKEENRAQKAMDDSRKVIICTWLEKNRGTEEKYDETAELNWGFPISKKVIEEFLADNNCDEILGKTE